MISADDIKATGANTFLDFLATVPSVGLYNPYGNVPALFMRIMCRTDVLKQTNTVAKTVRDLHPLP
jgi:hypothetical protein